VDRYMDCGVEGGQLDIQGGGLFGQAVVEVRS
jgi:hypothetical protein